MKLNVQEMQVKGMQQGSLYKTGDWFIPLCQDIAVDSDAGAKFDMPDQEYANRTLFLAQAPGSSRRTFRDMSRLLGVLQKGTYSGLDVCAFWEEVGYGFQDKLHGLPDLVSYSADSKVNEKCFAERGALPRHYLESLIDARADAINSAQDFIQAMAALTLVHADILGIKLHPETIKAALNYPDRYLAEVAETFGDTSVSAVRNAAYLDSTYGLCTPWGTFFDDAESYGVIRPEGVGRALMYASAELFRSLCLVNLYFANGRQSLVGLGFQDTNPMFILGKFTPSGKFVTSGVRVGRYFSAYADVLDVREQIEDLKPLNCELKTYLCKTEREWHDGYNGGVGSCMAGYPFCDSPVRIYATTSHGLPDNNLRLLIQYTGELWGDDFKVQARAIVNIEKMQYVRAYGKNSDGIMRALGYEEDKDCLDGCILAKIRNSDGYWLMVYSDGNHDQLDDHEDYWTLVYSGDTGADTACGYLEDYDSDRERAVCDNCDEYADADEVLYVETEDGTMQWCEGCRDFHATYIRGRGWVSEDLLGAEQAEEEDEEEDEDEEAA